MKKFLIKFLTFLLCTTLCFAVACTTPDDSGSGGDEGGSNPPPNERVTVEEFESKIDALQGSETVKLDAGNFGVLSFKTGVDSGQLLNGKPLYVRELEDITIEGKLDGTSKTTFLKTFKFETIKTVNDQSIMVKTTIKTLKFKDLTFNENIKLILNYTTLQNSPIYIENLVFENVTINNFSMSNITGRHGVAIETNCGGIKNILFTNSQVININSQNASGIHFNDCQGIEKITIQNSKISGINYNAVQVNKFRGELIIDSSNLSFTGSRILRIDDVREGAKITLTNNAFEASGSEEVFKISNIHPSTILTISNNTLNGAELTYDDYVLA